MRSANDFLSGFFLSITGTKIPLRVISAVADASGKYCGETPFISVVGYEQLLSTSKMAFPTEFAFESKLDRISIGPISLDLGQRYFFNPTISVSDSFDAIKLLVFAVKRPD